VKRSGWLTGRLSFAIISREVVLKRFLRSFQLDMTTSLQDKSAASAEAGLPGDVRAEFTALISGCALYNLATQARIAISGRDRVRWLNGMVSNNIRDLAAGHGVYAFLLNPQGRILGDLYVYNRGESFLAAVDGSQLVKVLELLRRYIIMDKVELENVSDKLAAVGVAGPSAQNTLATAGLGVPELAPLQIAQMSWQEVAMTVVRGDNPAVPSYELWLAPAEMAKVQEALLQAGAKPASAPAMELLRIAAGVPRYGQDIRERDLPQETEQQRALNFSKGCYIGQEIVERIRSRGAVHRKFTGFLIDGPLPQPGAKIQAEGKDVGEITSAADLPVAGGERKVALGYIRREAEGKALLAGDARVTVAAVPFADTFQEAR
jgi:folate-binding protein YgfZ